MLVIHYKRSSFLLYCCGYVYWAFIIYHIPLWYMILIKIIIINTFWIYNWLSTACIRAGMLYFLGDFLPCFISHNDIFLALLLWNLMLGASDWIMFTDITTAVSLCFVWMQLLIFSGLENLSISIYQTAFPLIERYPRQDVNTHIYTLTCIPSHHCLN